MSLGRILNQYRSDYQPIASLFNVENSTGFNAVYRISIGPVGIIFSSIVLYLLAQDQLVEGIWTASVWFFIAQAALFAGLARWKLVDKSKFFAFHAVSIALSVYLYDALITKGLDHLLPDETNLRTDMWLLLAVFIYGIFRLIPGSERKFGNRKDAYVTARAEKFRKKFYADLRPFDRFIQDAIVAVMIYEDFNRPKVVRLVEKMIGARTQNIMQTSNSRSDSESIATTGMKMSESLTAQPLPPTTGSERDDAIRKMLGMHNPGDPEQTFRASR